MEKKGGIGKVLPESFLKRVEEDEALSENTSKTLCIFYKHFEVHQLTEPNDTL